jgi:hypothetical protein
MSVSLPVPLSPEVLVIGPTSSFRPVPPVLGSLSAVVELPLVPGPDVELPVAPEPEFVLVAMVAPPVLAPVDALLVLLSPPVDAPVLASVEPVVVSSVGFESQPAAASVLLSSAPSNASAPDRSRGTSESLRLMT